MELIFFFILYELFYFYSFLNLWILFRCQDGELIPLCFNFYFFFSVIQVRGRGATGGGARELLGAPASHPDLPPAALRVGPRYRK